MSSSQLLRPMPDRRAPMASSLANRFAGDRGGTVAIIFGIAAFLVVGAVGAAVDYGRWMKVNTQMQNALDSAVLAGGRMLQTSNSPTTAITTAQQYFDQMASTLVQTGATRTFTVNSTNTIISGSSKATISTPFLSALGVTTLAVPNYSTATIAIGDNAGTNIEMSLMLDITGSMAGSKIVSLRNAASDLINIVVWDDQSKYTSKVAIVPFAPAVNVGSYVTQITGVAATKGSKKLIVCVTERVGSAALTDADPTVAGQYLSAYQGDNGTTAAKNSSNYSSSGSCSEPSASEEIVPLTSNKTILTNRVSNLTAGGGTAGQLGTAFAWYLLSPNWSKVWTGTSTPAPYADLAKLNVYKQPVLRKIAVLMTDGEYNIYLNANANVTTVNNNAKAICTNMKKAGIEIYTVGFDLGGSQLAIDLLSNCATDAKHFFNASDGNALEAAFREIALRVTTLHISS